MPCSDNFGEGPTPWDMPLPDELRHQWKDGYTRRHFLKKASLSLGGLGLAHLLGGNKAMAGGSLEAPHQNPSAKRVISLFMAGGPPHQDMFDYKPRLAEFAGKDIPASILGADFKPSGMTAGQSRFTVRPSSFKFQKHGKSGRYVSSALPYTAKCIDDLTMIHSMYSDAINHEPAIMLMNTANMLPGRPALGAWCSYGLGSLNENLPSFVVLNSNRVPGTSGQPVTPRLWSSAFLNAKHAGVPLRAGHDPVLYLNDPRGMSRKLRRSILDGIEEMNHRTLSEIGDPETNARIEQYEMAYRMQMSVPELSDLSNEPASTWQLYGEDAKKPGSFAYNCLMARRLAERGVRYTQVYQRGWDFHGALDRDLKRLCDATDRGTYALLTDLKQRGLMDDTLVVWGGEFGRTTYSQGDGRDHHAKCFTSWLAGAGVKPGMTYGATDDFAFNNMDPDKAVHPRDLIATICHCLGVDSNRLTKVINGVDLKPTGVIHPHLIKDILS
ncbi:sulfatase [Oceaniferula spumae]|uniref:Sulfatase n=1 Tax=Oceaniferula spumae TaxID=2979115 RepID=A0AAT9FKN4_9BACT